MTHYWKQIDRLVEEDCTDIEGRALSGLHTGHDRKLLVKLPADPKAMIFEVVTNSDGRFSSTIMSKLAALAVALFLRHDDTTLRERESSQ